MIPFVKTYLTGNEILNISEAIQSNASGDGPYTKECHAFLEKIIISKKCLLTTSCTSSLEMSAILSEVSIGDEVIMPSYTFVSTANAFISRGARVIFADIRKDTLNINEDIIEDLIKAAHNNAKATLKSKTSDEISKSASNFGIPGFKWPL